MKLRNTLFGLSLLSVSVIAYSFLTFSVEEQGRYSPREKQFNNTYYNNIQGIDGAMQYYYERRVNPTTGILDMRDVLRSDEAVRNFNKMNKSSAVVDLKWDEMGPDNVGGRSRALIVDNTISTGSKLYVGSVAGGLFISYNYGLTWVPNNDQAENLAISCITQAANGDVYYGTGEGFTGANGQGTLFTPGHIGRGIYKSLSGTDSFTQLPSTAPSDGNSSSVEWATTNRLGADPVDANRIYAANNKGIKVSYDAGTSWTTAIYKWKPPNSVAVVEGFADDLEVASDGTVLVTINGRAYVSETGDSASWISMVEDGSGKLKITTTASNNLSAGQFIQIIDGGNLYTGDYIVSSVSSPTVFMVDTLAGKPYTANISIGIVNSFVDITSKVTGMSGGTRLELAIAPSDPNYMYISSTTGGTHGVWQSKNKGRSWNLVVPYNDNLGGQGYYNSAIAVYPNEPEHFVIGGVELFGWNGKTNVWDIVALTFSFPGTNIYVHADKHFVVFHPNYNGITNQIYYVGGDGGVYGTFDGGDTFQALNTNYGVTQFYAMGTSREGWVAGGTQDNGNPFIDFTGDTKKSQVSNLPSGDGGYMQFSTIKPDAFFWESQGGDAKRSPDGANGGGSEFFATAMCTGPCDEGTNEGPWVTPMLIWENFNDPNSTDSVQYVVDQAYSAGATLYIPSNNDKFPFEYVTPVPLGVNDTVMIQDKVQSKFFVCTFNGVFMSKDVLDFSKDPDWYKLSALGAITCIEVSNDGDIVYLGGGWQGAVYRVSGILSLDESDDHTDGDAGNPQVSSKLTETLINSAGSYYLTGIGVDPRNSENVVIARGSYGSTLDQHVMYSTTAASTTGSSSFTSIQGDLPIMPVYDALIDMSNSNIVIIATEYGVWATDNATDANPTWSRQINGFPNVPSYMIIQQTNPNNKCSGVTNEGYIYVCTHGRGIFRTRDYAAIQDTTECNLPVGIEENYYGDIAGSMQFYPNPVVNGSSNVSFELVKPAEIVIKIYDLHGKVVQMVEVGKRAAGNHIVQVNTNHLQSGTYFVSLNTNTDSKVQKFIVVK